MFTVLIQNDKEGERKSKLDEENLLNETHTHGMYTTELMLAFFSSNLDCNLFRRNFFLSAIRQFRLLNPPIFHLQTLWYMGSERWRMERAWKKKRVEWIKLVKARTSIQHAFSKQQTSSTKSNTDTFIATAIKLRRFVCHSQGIYSISSMCLLHLSICVSICVCRFHFMKLNVASNVAFVKWISFPVLICSIRAHTAHTHTDRQKGKTASFNSNIRLNIGKMKHIIINYYTSWCINTPDHAYAYVYVCSLLLRLVLGLSLSRIQIRCHCHSIAN